MEQVVVTGMGLVTALGNREQTWAQLLAGQSGIVSGDIYPIATIPDTVLFPHLQHYHRVERLLLQAIEAALADINYVLPLENCGVVVGSSRSYQEAWEGGTWVLPAALSGQVVRQLQCQGPTIGISAACATGNWVLARAFQLLQAGECAAVIVAATDSALTPLSIAGFQQMGVLAKQGCYPFSQEREGIVLGEAACALILEKFPTTNTPYGKVLGVGITNDAYHITTPDPTGQAAKKSIFQCLDAAGISPEAIDVISPHGTATPNNDRQEAALISQIFPHAPWICPSKGATGHALGASGLLEAAFCLLMLHHQQVFPCVGLRTPIFDLRITDRAQKAPLHYALNMSFGFGGQNAVVCFGS